VPTEHFQDAEKYRKYRAYVHLHHIPTHATNVVVSGKKHKVKHSKDGKITKGKGTIGRTAKYIEKSE
jgi:hypothetical protein